MPKKPAPQASLGAKLGDSPGFDLSGFLEGLGQHTKVLFPGTLSAAERAWLHEFAEGIDAVHTSTGESSSRRLEFGKKEEGGVLEFPAHVTLSIDQISTTCRALVGAAPAGAPVARRSVRQRSSAITEAAAASSIALRGGAGDLEPMPLDVSRYADRMIQAVELEKASEMATALDASEPAVAVSRASGLCLAPVIAEECFVGAGGERVTFVPGSGGPSEAFTITSAGDRTGAAATAAKGKGKKGKGAAPSPSASGGGGRGGGGGTASGDTTLPAHRIAPHDVVCIRPMKNPPPRAEGIRGLVTRVTPSSITVAIDADSCTPDASDGALRIDKLANEVTFERLMRTVTDLMKVCAGTVDPSGRGASLAGRRPIPDAMFRRCDPPEGEVRTLSCDRISFFNDRLDDSQRRAVALAAHSNAPFAMVHGPPGTGKTTAVVEIILQHIICHKRRVLVASASNIAVDTIVERLVAAGGSGRRFTTVRYGHPARLLECVVECSLESVCARHPSTRDTAAMRKELRDVSQTITRRSTTTKDRNDAFKVRRQLTADIRAVERGVQDEVLDRAECVAATLTGVATDTISRLAAFDVVVIDEAAQATELAALTAVLRGQFVVLAGDHLQLPPTVVSEEAVAKGLAVTLFERLMRSGYAAECSAMLTTQYRMNELIMRWSSDSLYGGLLEAAESVADRTLPTGDAPLLYIDTSGCGEGYTEEILEDGFHAGSVWNEGEARAAMAVVKHLLDGGVPPHEIGIISPYNAQVGVLCGLRSKCLGSSFVGIESQLEISTVDGFQGREKDAIIITLCRSNEAKTVGFVSDFRRLNVAVTRAKRFVCVIGDSDTLRTSETLASLIDYLEANGTVASALEWDDV